MKKTNFSIKKLFNKSFKIRLSKKRVIAFSLVELMISLIAISVIAAAFTPVISKRLKGGSSVGSGGIKKECKYIDKDCVSCSAQGCLDCKKDCPPSESKDILTCSCIKCEEILGGIPNCISCRYKSYSDRTKVCLKCRNGFDLDETTGKCVKCQDGDTCDGVNSYETCQERWAKCTECNATTCKKCDQSDPDYSGWNVDQQICTNCGEHCIKCDNSACQECDTGYAPNNKGECTLIMDLVEHNGKKWSAKNAGDPRGPAIPDGIAICTIGQSCNTGGASGICWQGDTSGGACNDSSGNNYTGCGRTVCNWAAANEICKYYGMSLPTADDIKSLGNGDGSFLAPKNLNMCYSTSIIGIVEPEVVPNLGSGGNASKCAQDNIERPGCGGNCNPQKLWGQNKDWGETNSFRKYQITGNPCNAYRNDCIEYRNDCTAYRNDCTAYRNDCRAYRNDCRQYGRQGYTTFCLSNPNYCSSAPPYCSSNPKYCSSNPKYCSSNPQYCSQYKFTYSWSNASLSNIYHSNVAPTNEAFSVRCVSK